MFGLETNLTIKQSTFDFSQSSNVEVSRKKRSEEATRKLLEDETTKFGKKSRSHKIQVHFKMIGEIK